MKANMLSLFLGLTNGKRLRIGGITFYDRMGVLCCCLSKREHCSGENWKPVGERGKANDAFKGDRKHSSHVKDVYKDMQVWGAAVKELGIEGMSKDNYRQRLNSGCFRGEGMLVNPEQYKASTGLLFLPNKLKMEVEGDLVVLTWEVPTNTYRAKLSDRLHVQFMRESENDALQWVTSINATRGDGRCEFRLEGLPGDKFHLFPFFGNVKNDSFSRNTYFSL